ncbi:coproporphyrinogen-III oxidase family protein [Acidipila sp. EB88]|uniref:coproporphyrinogen-III oxidase family protein n=1 Tax=Acidipila sp. EB88 TaxID=2305226 RepID=UPI000F5F691A|nr:coproporphyrinogen-III oxidase family protein [Acidipila sp. EB88]RRA47340.1 coproporphyrinogen III oxidase family protein [Acidipila sp. EB88]
MPDLENPIHAAPGDARPPRPDTLGLYLAVPFCRAKCTFCNFASGVYPASAMPAYVAALERQLAAARAWAHRHSLTLPHTIDTIYLGGGTPSLLPPDLLTTLFHTIREHFHVLPDAEITLEAAPLQLDPDTLDAGLTVGLNRVSFGVQSFVEAEARATARTHSGDEALAEIERMRRSGVAHVSADLIAGLPGQTTESWHHSLDRLTEASLDHSSVYMFELDEDSRLGAEALRGGARFGAALLPREDIVADWYAAAIDRLAQAGLAQYEISNFARPGGRSVHNERYWLRRPYLGVGVDAHSMLRHAHTGAAARFAIPEELDAFLAPHHATTWDEPELLTPREELEEAWFLGLRRTAGVSLALLTRQFGGDALAPFSAVLAELAEADLLTRTPGDGGPVDRVALTRRGQLLSNDVFAALLAAEDQPAPEQNPQPLPHAETQPSSYPATSIPTIA